MTHEQIMIARGRASRSGLDYIARLALLGMLLVAGRAQAGARDDAAKQHFVRGYRAYNLAHYDEAIREYEKAYELHDDPALLFNIAQAHRLAGHPAEAARFYRTYLRLDPRSPQRAEIEARIAEMDAAVQSQQRQPSLPPQGTFAPGDTGGRSPNGTATRNGAAPRAGAMPASAATGFQAASAAAESEMTSPRAEEEGQGEPTVGAAAPEQVSPKGVRPWYKDSLAMSLAGVGIVGIGVGVGLISYGSVVSGQADSATTAIDASRLRGDAKTLYMAGGIALGAGVALGVGAIVKWLVGPKVPVSVVVGPGYGYGVLTRSF